MPTTQTEMTLEKVFKDATSRGNNSYFFSDIWIPLRDRNETTHVMSDPPTYTYEPVGVTPEQLAQIYWTLYSRNLLSVPLVNWTEDQNKYNASVSELTLKIKSIFTLNLYKYLKWIESMGYAYNPLWNVDGVEEYQWIDNHGEIVRDTDTTQTTLDALSTAPYDTSAVKLQNQTDGSYSGNVNTSETHENIVTGPVNGVITPVTGGDFSHIEKRIRQGNIGVTKTTELLNDERELVKFNLIQEFFNDINKQLLVGIYI